MVSRIPGDPEGKVVLNSKGMRDLLKSAGIATELRGRMQVVRAALPGSDLRMAQRPTRVVAQVWRGSNFDEANSGELSRALDFARGLRGRKQSRMKRANNG